MSKKIILLIIIIVGILTTINFIISEKCLEVTMSTKPPSYCKIIETNSKQICPPNTQCIDVRTTGIGQFVPIYYFWVK